MRVLMVSKACYVAAYRRKLEEMVRQPGLELTLVVPPHWRFGRRIARLEPGFDHGYEMVVANPVLNGAHHLHFYPRLGRLMRQLRPDIVHVDEEPYDLVTFHALKAAAANGARVVFFTWQNLRRSFPPPFCWLETYILRQADGAIAGNLEASEVLTAKGFKGRLAIIPQFGVDTSIYHPVPAGALAPGSKVRLGYLGRLVPEKGLSVLLKAVTHLRGCWTLDLAGEGPMEGDLRSLIRSQRLSGRVALPGSIPSSDVPGYLRGLDVLVLPSLTTGRWKEQFGRVLVEAMASGVVVVGSDSGEIPNVIGDSGLICREGDDGDLGRALQELIDDGSLRRRLAAEGRKRAEELFSQRRVADRTVAFYQSILDSAAS